MGIDSAGGRLLPPPPGQPRRHTVATSGSVWSWPRALAPRHRAAQCRTAGQRGGPRRARGLGTERHPETDWPHAEREAAGRAQEYPEVKLAHEVLTGHPVECLAEAAEHAPALVVGRRGRGDYTGIRLGSVVHGLLHRAHCPVITVPGG
ncbi:universal stress protein [Streptomyces sp. NBC_01244]|uniref:universal stress protein n=1 Tax=Streptomyces sp. NBC_01244 TaxID=2903797 RepID=UPI003FA351CB